MLRSYLAPAALVLSSLALHAQVSLNSPDNVPLVGTSFASQFLAVATPPGAAGADQTWDLSALTGGTPRTYQWMDPNDYSSPSTFPDATLMLTGDGDSIFYKETTNGLEVVGEHTSILSFSAVVPLSDPYLAQKLPCSMGTTWTDTDAASFSIDGVPGTFTRSGVINGHADAYGTLMLPGSTVNVLRVYTYLNEFNDGGLSDITHKRHTYSYYQLFGKVPVLRIISDTLTATFPSTTVAEQLTEWLDSASVGIEQRAIPQSDFAIFPNPAQDQVSVMFAFPATAGDRVDVMDATGRLVHSTSINGAMKNMDVRGWNNGAYAVTLRKADGTFTTRRFIKQ
jgi:hypothetical protein